MGDSVKNFGYQYSAKMKIAVLTLPLHTNYGGILQAFALQTILQRMGHEVHVFDKSHLVIPYPPLIEYILLLIKRFIKKYVLFDSHIEVFFERNRNRVYSIISRNTQKFIQRYINTRIIDDLTTLKQNEYDAYVVGSDQVWRPLYFCFGSIDYAYLSFAERWNHVKRIAYAPSFGTNQWEYTVEQTAICGGLLQKFDLVTIREDDGVRLCQEQFHVKAVQVPDPTLLLTSSDYECLVRNAHTRKSNGQLLVYILDSSAETERLVADVAQQKRAIPFYISSKVENKYAPLQERIQISVEQWLRGFTDAEYVITDSFHGCIFSILFNKPFVVLENLERGMSRIYSLLRLFNLEDRLITSSKTIDSLKNIDWTSVNQIRKEQQSFVEELLKKQLQF